jgi:hypothetical protein
MISLLLINVTPSHHDIPARRAERLAREEVAILGSQEQRRRDDVLDFADASQWIGADDLVAHAVRALDENETPARIAELAAGLGYWAACYQELPTDLSISQPISRPRTAIYKVAVVPSGQRKFTGTIVGSLERLDEFPAFASVIGLADLSGEASGVVSDLTETFARVYLANAHDVLSTIVFIHGITSGAALRLLAPHLSESVLRATLRYTWQAQCAIYAAFGQSCEPPPEIIVPRESHDELIAMAITNGDEHVIKLTEACLREHALNATPVYLAAARHAMDVLKG